MENGQSYPEQMFKCPECGKIVEESTLCEECLDKKNRKEKIAIEGILSMVVKNKSKVARDANLQRHFKDAIEDFIAGKIDLKAFLSKCQVYELITSRHLDGTMCEEVCTEKYYSDLESMGISFPAELRSLI